MKSSTNMESKKMTRKCHLTLSAFVLSFFLAGSLAGGALIHSMGVIRAAAQTRNSIKGAAQKRDTAGGANIPAPETTLGFKIGEDRKLAKWDQFVAYFGELAKASDRISLETLGKTTLGRPFIAATISSPENL